MMQARICRREILGVVFLLALALAISGCGDSSSSNGRAIGDTGDNVAFVLTTDYKLSSSYSTIDLTTNTASKDLPAQAGIVESDNAGAYFNGRIYIINRGAASNITVVDKADPTVALNQFSTGDGTNPYAMAFNSDTEAYVCLYAKNEIVVVDPTATTDQIKATIDLSGFMAAGDPDDKVEAATMIKVNDYLFVALQRLNRNNFFAVENDALLVVIDTTTNEIVDVDDTTAAVDAIALTGRNPQFMFYDEASGKIFVSETGSYGVNDGGVETVDPTAFEAEGFLIDESELGGDVGAVAVSNGTGYVVVAVTFPNNTVMTFDTTDGTKGDDLFVNDAYIPSLTLDDQGRLFVPDRSTTTPGVRIYDTADNSEITTGVIDVGLPPNVILVY